MGPGEVIAIAIAAATGSFVLLPIVITRMVLRHREKLTAMRYRQEGAPGLIEEVAALRGEVAALRETTTKFDMAFDAELARLERRLGSLEEGKQEPSVSVAPEEPVQSMLRR